MIVETGLRVVGANSYASVDFADTYHDDRQNLAWAAATDTQKEAALIKATDFLEGKYRGRWSGYRVNPKQPLSWPRMRVYPAGETYEANMGYVPASLAGIPIAWATQFVQEISNSIVPDEVQKATAELALKIISGTDLSPDLTGKQVIMEKVDVIEVKYSEYARRYPEYPAIEALIRVYLRTGSTNNGTVSIIR